MSNCICIISTVFGVVFGLSLVGIIVYVAMVHESQCYKGCDHLCSNNISYTCSDVNCFQTCWRAEWTKCPEHGAKVCAYILFDKIIDNEQ